MAWRPRVNILGWMPGYSGSDANAVETPTQIEDDPIERIRDRQAQGIPENDVEAPNVPKPPSSPQDTLKKFGYDDETINSMDASVKEETAKLWEEIYPNGPPKPIEHNAQDVIDQLAIKDPEDGWPGVRPGIRGSGPHKQHEEGPKSDFVPDEHSRIDRTDQTAEGRKLNGTSMIDNIMGAVGDRLPAPGVAPAIENRRGLSL